MAIARCTLGLAAALALLAPAGALRSGAGVGLRAGPRAVRSAFVAMSDEGAAVAAESADVPAVAEEVEVSGAEQAALQKTHTNKRKRPSRPEPTVQLADLEVGATVEGVVRNIVSYGAFVDIGAPKDGMLHVSDISNSYVSNITDVISVGDTVSARIKSVDTKAGRFALIMKDDAPARGGGGGGGAASGGQRQKRSKADLTAIADFDPKAMMKGSVVSVMDFGCFVSINDNVDGLVHISQLQEGRTDNVADVVKVGDQVDVRIIGIDFERQRVSLSMLPYSEQAAAKQGGSSDGQTRRPRGGGRSEYDGPPFESTAVFQGAKAVMDDEEDAPTLFEHAWVEAQEVAQSKGASVPDFK
mmetsp:Transcript_7202/g.21199  ORF Transcript_7202/g.21199 Transcript_7202/m.21199 type:complete len:357 (+) Transcript_7202:20-1090(+)|eukprot:CAMPEP_0206048886 /NCGR_PEP_ID=MMETSP1466-20131121/25351_1 /ASSEMBLY_ACC=CAM_ASM_001126 /TAXON_ID=44452 /ORGANISM="Pavlova gyrans, Strain CCMP608" /LENGTH=356 /DNA_ID=CAMNT_0053423961 /DNA_START=8 /DNA_END=1078 /DNA_ORIENTATION=+